MRLCNQLYTIAAIINCDIDDQRGHASSKIIFHHWEK